MAVVGPGASQQNEVAPSATLEGASEWEFVTILNPLTDDFAVRVAQDIPVNMPMHIRSGTGGVQNESDLLRTYGDTFKNPDFKAKKHIVNDTIIKAGETINLKGNEAQVAVRQLVNEILQRNGKRRLMADPNLRKEVEEQIIIYRGSVQDLMDGNIQSARSQVDNAIKQSNEAHDEPTFPGLTDVSEAGRGTDPAEANTGDGDPVAPKKMGRPKKADS